MALPKICGIETEYGIICRGIEMSPVATSSLLISAYSGNSNRIEWDFTHESPGVDARGFRAHDRLDPEIDYQLVNTVLTNGARYYVDHAHPEYSSPECRSAIDCLVYDLAGDEIVRRSMLLADAFLGVDGVDVVAYKNNSDGKGNSYGCHENYLLDRKVPFSEIVRAMTLHFVTRQIYTGAGKLGVENGVPGSPSTYQISQRADFFEEEVGLETTLRRPIINTRDEPHADPLRYRRLHVIVGDANMSQTATFLKIGTTQLLLAMLEDGAIPVDLALDEPLRALRSVSLDLGLTSGLRMRDGRLLTALEIQFDLLRAAERWSEACLDCPMTFDERRIILGEWRETLESLARDRSELVDRVDWIAKESILMAYRERHDLAPHDPRLKMIDIQYHDLRPTKGLASRSGLRRIVDDDRIHHATTNPPRDTRAFLRGEFLRRWPQDVVSANWDGLLIDVGAGALRRLSLADPTFGSGDAVSAVMERSADMESLLDGLDSMG